MHETLLYRDLSRRANLTAAHECGQAIFNGCPGPLCDRPCSVRMYTPPPVAERNCWTGVLYAAGCAVIAVTITAGVIACIGQGVENWRAVQIAQEPV